MLSNEENNFKQEQFRVLERNSSLCVRHKDAIYTVHSGTGGGDHTFPCLPLGSMVAIRAADANTTIK